MISQTIIQKMEIGHCHIIFSKQLFWMFIPIINHEIGNYTVLVIFTMLMTRLLMMTAIENDDDDDVIVMIELLSWPVGEPPSISLDHFGPTSSLSLNQNPYHHSYHSLRTIMLVSRHCQNLVA